jgi:probable addiction module antidote protein
MALETLAFDPAEYLTSQRAQTALIADALKSGDAGYIAAAIGTVARARGMAKVAKDAGVARASLYKALSETGDPQLTTLIGVLKAMGYELSVRATKRAA